VSDAFGSQLAQLLGFAVILALGAVIFVSVADARARGVLGRVRAMADPATVVETPARRTIPLLGPLALIPSLNAAMDSLLVLAGDTLYVFDRIALFGAFRFLFSRKYCWAGDRSLDVEASELMVIDDVNRSGDVLEFILLNANDDDGGRVQLGSAAYVGFLIPQDSARDILWERLAPLPEEQGETLSPR
jgi:hypothetical protein